MISFMLDSLELLQISTMVFDFCTPAGHSMYVSIRCNSYFSKFHFFLPGYHFSPSFESSLTPAMFL